MRPGEGLYRPLGQGLCCGARKCEAVRLLIDYHKGQEPEIATLQVEDLRESRLEEMQRTYEWLKSWGMLEATASPLDLVNLEVQNQAHSAAD